jgi:hypothetical protein
VREVKRLLGDQLISLQVEEQALRQLHDKIIDHDNIVSISSGSGNNQMNQEQPLPPPHQLRHSDNQEDE